MRSKTMLLFIALVSIIILAKSGYLYALYDKMYPADAFQRAAFDLCQSSDASFVRLREADRAACLDRMPAAVQPGDLPAPSVKR